MITIERQSAVNILVPNYYVTSVSSKNISDYAINCVYVLMHTMFSCSCNTKINWGAFTPQGSGTELFCNVLMRVNAACYVPFKFVYQFHIIALII